MKKHRDYCGPAGSAWVARLVSWLIPDSLWGIDLSPCCITHDIEYGIGGPEALRKKCDKEFRNCIYVKCRLGGLGLLRSRMVAEVYYRGVRWGGKNHFNYK